MVIEIAEKTYGTRASNSVTPNLQLYSLLIPHMDVYSDPIHAIFAPLLSIDYTSQRRLSKVSISFLAQNYGSAVKG